MFLIPSIKPSSKPFPNSIIFFAGEAKPQYSAILFQALTNMSRSFPGSSSKGFFIPSIKINFYLKGFKKFFSGRKIFIAKEISKIHETFFRSDIDKINLFKTSFKGELTVVISEKNTKDKSLDENKVINKAKLYLKKYSLKDVVDLIFETEKTNKKKIYEICLMVKKDEENN